MTGTIAVRVITLESGARGQSSSFTVPPAVLGDKDGSNLFTAPSRVATAPRWKAGPALAGISRTMLSLSATNPRNAYQ